ncbi:hypothetical protein TPHA_0B01500 [Tetrapisispora phaffii CBS 4417]|uniref:Indoleamine 2,3-dioxygenase n=1 Tax=Tetrapisispora phaffii (strain ATCC 24235 / CBS 4417 / NBRC 1672 / NRRL Y-8282 / UCD 70-5) TaxID=1071381 RepID=G8BP92_TETPH|nr:hypothetical protein TPHA_0B01500 [Tetrapisispora phaffii CBS 4417]CCE61823.1 hypothetical protein TPHA_0B01500 [Tetrapisispora phaffii CBS 4417]
MTGILNYIRGVRNDDITLEKYAISAKYGFLSTKQPVQFINIEYYKPWEDIIENLPDLLKEGNLREEIDTNLPILEVSDELLNNVFYLRRAYSILTFLTNAYVWGNKFNGETPIEILSDNIAKPLLKIANILGLPPLSTYAGLILWNFKTVSANNLCCETDPIQIEILNTFTDLDDERWFYIISVFYEKIGGSVLECGVEILNAIKNEDIRLLKSRLNLISSYTYILGDLFTRMNEHTNPDIFYNVLRPFLTGWENSKDLGLPNGVKYGRHGKYKKFAGGSNAQSSLIQFIDILLNVEHKNEEGVANGLSYILEMRKYMPYLHRKFLEHFSAACKLKEFVLKHADDHPDLVKDYDDCLDNLKMFRDKHVKLVTTYIITPSRKAKTLETNKRKHHINNGLAIKGTGSTSFVLFLKQCRTDTVDAGINFKKGKRSS